MPITAELGQYGLVGVCLALVMVIWYLITKLTDAQSETTKSMLDVMRANTAVLESVRTMVSRMESAMLAQMDRSSRG